MQETASREALCSDIIFWRWLSSNDFLMLFLRNPRNLRMNKSHIENFWFLMTLRHFFYCKIEGRRLNQ